MDGQKDDSDGSPFVIINHKAEEEKRLIEEEKRKKEEEERKRIEEEKRKAAAREGAASSFYLLISPDCGLAGKQFLIVKEYFLEIKSYNPPSEITYGASPSPDYEKTVESPGLETKFELGMQINFSGLEKDLNEFEKIYFKRIREEN